MCNEDIRMRMHIQNNLQLLEDINIRINIQNNLELLIGEKDDIDDGYLKLKKYRNDVLSYLYGVYSDLKNFNRWDKGISIKLNKEYCAIINMINIIQETDLIEYIEENIEIEFESSIEFINLYRVGFEIDDVFKIDDYETFEENIDSYNVTTLQAYVISKIIAAKYKTKKILDNTNREDRRNLLEAFLDTLYEYEDKFLLLNLDNCLSSYLVIDNIVEDDYNSDKRVTIDNIRKKVRNQIEKLREVFKDENLEVCRELIYSIEEVIDDEESIMEHIFSNQIYIEGLDGENYNKYDKYDDKKKADRERNKLNRRNTDGLTKREQKRKEQQRKIEKLKSLVFDLKAKGLGRRKIALELGEQESLIRKILNNQ